MAYYMVHFLLEGGFILTLTACWPGHLSGIRNEEVGIQVVFIGHTHNRNVLTISVRTAEILNWHVVQCMRIVIILRTKIYLLQLYVAEK